MKRICKNCAHWSDVRLVLNGHESKVFRLCQIQTTDHCRVFSYANSLCDCKIEAFEEKTDEDDN